MTAPVQPQPQQPPNDFSALYDAQQASQAGAPKDFSDLYDQQQAAQAKAGPPMSKSAAWSDQIGDKALMGATPKLTGAMAGIEGAGKYMLDTMAPGSNASWGGLADAASSAYATERDRMRQELAAAEQQHPLPLVGKIGAALLNPVAEFLPGGGAAKTALGAVGKTALGGAAAGGLQAAAQTVGGPMDYAKNIALGTAAGGLTGAALGGGGQVLGKLAAQVGKYAAPYYSRAFAQPDITEPAVIKAWTDIADKSGVELPEPPPPPVGSLDKMMRTNFQADPQNIPASELEATARAADIANAGGAKIGLRSAPPAPSGPASLSIQQIDQIKKAADATAKNLKNSADGAQRNAGMQLENQIRTALQPVDAARPLYPVARQAGKEGVGRLMDLLQAAKSAQGGSIGAVANLGSELAEMPASQRGLGATSTLGPAAGQLTSSQILSLLQGAGAR